MNFVHKLAFLSLALGFTGQQVFAQQPFAPTVLATTGGSSKVLWGSFNGSLIRSADLGNTWLPVYVTEPGLPQPRVLFFEIDSLDPNTVYLATTLVAGGVFKSTDGGTTWAKANAGLPQSGGQVEFFKQIPLNPNFFYVKIGDILYKSIDRAATWRIQGTLPLPGTSPNFDINEQFYTRMYYVDEGTLRVYTSLDEGRTWSTFGAIPAMLQPARVLGVGSLYTNGAVVYTSVDGTGSGQASYQSIDFGQTNLDATGSGLGLFSTFRTANFGPVYAFGAPGGAYRSIDNGMTWKNIGKIGLEQYELSTIDPFDRTIVYAIRTVNTRTLVRSADAGDSWTPIPSTITPSISKPSAGYNIVLQEGAPYSIAFPVQAVEDPTWVLNATVTTSGETWLTVGTASGTTPFKNSFTINSQGLAPGNYTSTLVINAPLSANKSVKVTINLTIRPLGSIGPGYQISTLVGNGNASDIKTSGPATSIGIGAAQAATFDNSNNLLISAGNRIWQMTGTNLTLLAGNGVAASAGDGLDPTQASLASPEAIAVDPVGDIFFTEYGPGQVRKLSGSNISTPLQFSRYNVTTGSHSLLLDSVNRYLLTGPQGLLRYDGIRLQVVNPYPFVDPYGMVVGPDGNYYITDRGANRVFQMTPTGTVTTYAGTGISGFAGDGGLAVQANFSNPSGLVFDAQGTLYVVDSGNQRVRAIATDGTVRTIAGSGVSGFAGDNQTADFAAFQNPSGIAIDNIGALYVADNGNNRIRKLTLRVVPTPKPSILVKASSKTTTLAPGALFELYGDSLAGAVQTNSIIPWPRSIAGVSVTINGVPAPLYYISPSQINGQVPYETPAGNATAVVAVNGSSPAQIGFNVAPASPGILAYDGTRAVAVNQDGSVNASNAGAAPGDYEVVYLSGIGQGSPVVATGAAAPAIAPFSLVNYSYSITLNGQPCQVLFLGHAPGFPALDQGNFIIPNLPPGDYPLVVTVNGQSSDPLTLTVRAK